jgi:hypothetical protein
MKYEDFLFVGLQLQKQDKVINKLNELNMDVMDLVDPYYMIVDKLMREVYGEEGADWFNWFCFENDFGTKGLEAWDENKNPICYNWESLWECLENIKNK